MPKVSLLLEDALAAGAFLLLIYVGPTFLLSIEREQAPPPRVPCDITIAQNGPGERWAPHPPQPACASAARELPSHILTSPITEGAK